MPSYYFDISDGPRRLVDEIGTDLVDPEHARAAALATLPDLARDTPPNGNRREIIIDVRDAAHKLIFTATLSMVARWLH